MNLKNLITMKLEEFHFFIITILLLPLLITQTQSDPVNNNNNGTENQKIHQWTISDDICSDQVRIEGGCSCPMNNDSYRIIQCQCHPNIKTAHLTKPNKKILGSEETVSTTLIIQHCSTLNIYREAFSTISGLEIQIKIRHVGLVELEESSFELKPKSKENLARKIKFENVTIERVPSNSFPSNLDSIEFINSQIGTMSALAFQGVLIQSVQFQSTRISVIESRAFPEKIFINNSFLFNNSTIEILQSEAIASSITNMLWNNSHVSEIHDYSMSGIITNATFTGNKFDIVSSNGLTLKDWTSLSFWNNTFEYVQVNGIDLTQNTNHFNPGSTPPYASIVGNTWKSVETDFIKVGQSKFEPFTMIEENKFGQECNCSPTFLTQVSQNGTSSWFLDQLWNNSYCLTTPKGSECLAKTDLYVSHEEWKLLCSEQIFLCMNELTEVTDVLYTTPPSSEKLRLLAIFIGSAGLVIVVLLILVLCVYMFRRPKSNSREQLDDPRNMKPYRMNGTLVKDGPPHSHSTNNHPYAVIISPRPSVSEQSIPRSTVTIRPRSKIFEDVEMEDKGCQTMPNDLSIEVLEGLKAKLQESDPNWNHKETIDHLYDLIQVRSPSSPPDITMLTSSSDPQYMKNNKRIVNGNVMPRYAQIRPKPKTAPICEYGDPSDSQLHIYSELSSGSGPGRQLQLQQQQVGEQKQSMSSQTKDSDLNHIHHPHPILCEYTEPKDVQNHVYAELAGPTNPSATMPINLLSQNKRQRPIIRPPVIPNSPRSIQRPLPSLPHDSLAQLLGKN